eukprot:366438-Chlamydomonas_euryale.AAC.2
MDAGAGDLLEQRATDISVEKCKKRYAIFKQHYGASLRLKQFFPFHLIDAMGTLSETQEAITTELRCGRLGPRGGVGRSVEWEEERGVHAE